MMGMKAKSTKMMGMQHEDKDGNIWDVCTMCPKAGGKRRPACMGMLSVIRI